MTSLRTLRPPQRRGRSRPPEAHHFLHLPGYRPPGCRPRACLQQCCRILIGPYFLGCCGCLGDRLCRRCRGYPPPLPRFGPSRTREGRPRLRPRLPPGVHRYIVHRSDYFLPWIRCFDRNLNILGINVRVGAIIVPKTLHSTIK